VFVQRVVIPVTEVESWTVLGQDGTVVAPVEGFLAYLTACNLEFNPMIDDSVAWPCLRFDNTKVSSEQRRLPANSG
jgi:hypothetical protein